MATFLRLGIVSLNMPFFPWAFFLFWLSDGTVQLRDGELRCHAGERGGGGGSEIDPVVVASSCLMTAFFFFEVSSGLSSRRLSANREAAFLLVKVCLPSFKRLALGEC